MPGLLDFLQAASNSAASNVSGPVDAFAWLLNKAGVPVQNPVLGSQWMADKGLTKQVPQSAASLAGETLGLLSPIVASAKAPQIATGLLAGQDLAKQGAMAVGQKAADMTGDYMARQGLLQPATVWHGSPHKFDAFDASKIGTGEGAQAYGHGLYLAEKPEVAGSYAEVLGGGKTYTLNGKPVRVANMRPEEQQAMQALTDLASYGPTKEAYISRLLEQDADPRFVEKISSAWDRLAKQNPQAVINKGNLYKVDLPDSAIAKMLDWDKPLSQQAPEVQKALGAKGMPTDPLPVQHGWNTGGARTWESFVKELGGQDKAAEYLASKGIPGIRYLDGNSRGAGAGSSNYVVFAGNEGLLKILERNGQQLQQAEKPGLLSNAADSLEKLRSAWSGKGVALDAYSSQATPNVITLSKLEVPKQSRGQGVGSEAMKDLVRLADEGGKTVALSPSTDFGASSKGRLVDFYKRFGFVENKGRNKDFTISESMYRPPQSGESKGLLKD